MIQIDMKMPSCCNECQLCSCQKIGLFYCDVTASYIDIDSDERDADCPLKEVPSGKWLYDEDRGATGVYAICSECNELIYQTDEFKYCPNCGAKMEQTGGKT